MTEQGKTERERQCQMVREFDKTWHTYTSKGMEPVEKLAKGVYLVMVGMLMVIPFAKDEMDFALIVMLNFGTWPIMLLLGGRMTVKEGNKQQSIYDKLKYLPVSRAAIRQVRMEYLIHFLKLPLLVAICAQIAGTLIAKQPIGVATILYPLIAQGAYPFLMGLAMTLDTRR